MPYVFQSLFCRTHGQQAFSQTKMLSLFFAAVYKALSWVRIITTKGLNGDNRGLQTMMAIMSMTPKGIPFML